MNPPKFALAIVMLIFIKIWLAMYAYGGYQYSNECFFTNPAPVIIEGLPDGFGGTPISTEEPFLSRDGKFLFFNSHKYENKKDLHYAKYLTGKWIYQGEIGPGVNNKKDVQGNPTMDRFYNFFYIDSGVESMVRIGRFSKTNGELSNLRVFQDIPKRKVKLFAQKVHGNMGVEVSNDGAIVFFSRATWDMNGLSIGKLLESDILFVRKSGKHYVFDEAEVMRIMRQINSPDLDYAASISSDGLELFFTRLAIKDIKPGNARSTILRAIRTSVSEPFGKPEVIEAIGRNNFVEGPTISADEKELYYHKLEGNKFRLYKVTRQGYR